MRGDDYLVILLTCDAHVMPDRGSDRKCIQMPSILAIVSYRPPTNYHLSSSIHLTVPISYERAIDRTSINIPLCFTLVQVLPLPKASKEDPMNQLESHRNKLRQGRVGWPCRGAWLIELQVRAPLGLGRHKPWPSDS